MSTGMLQDFSLWSSNEPDDVDPSPADIVNTGRRSGLMLEGICPVCFSPLLSLPAIFVQVLEIDSGHPALACGVCATCNSIRVLIQRCPAGECEWCDNDRVCMRFFEAQAEREREKA